MNEPVSGPNNSFTGQQFSYLHLPFGPCKQQVYGRCLSGVLLLCI